MVAPNDCEIWQLNIFTNLLISTFYPGELTCSSLLYAASKGTLCLSSLPPRASHWALLCFWCWSTSPYRSAADCHKTMPSIQCTVAGQCVLFPLIAVGNMQHAPEYLDDFMSYWWKHIYTWIPLLLCPLPQSILVVLKIILVPRGKKTVSVTSLSITTTSDITYQRYVGSCQKTIQFL